MLHTVNHGLTGCQQQPSPDHAVWGDMCRPRALPSFGSGCG
jgi:hypothetical protein